MTTVLRAYLVDDSLAANRRLARVLEETARVDVVGSATLPMVALGEIAQRAVDVLFLDLQIARLTGFDLLERLPANPQVVFVIGRDQKDAGRALDQSGVPYVTKPVTLRRLSQTLDALETRRGHPNPGQLSEVLERLADYRLNRRVPEYADRIAVHVGRRRIRLLQVTTISHFVTNRSGRSP